jgi:hypothetical protein
VTSKDVEHDVENQDDPKDQNREIQRGNEDVEQWVGRCEHEVPFKEALCSLSHNRSSGPFVRQERRETRFELALVAVKLNDLRSRAKANHDSYRSAFDPKGAGKALDEVLVRRTIVGAGAYTDTQRVTVPSSGAGATNAGRDVDTEPDHPFPIPLATSTTGTPSF